MRNDREFGVDGRLQNPFAAQVRHGADRQRGAGRNPNSAMELGGDEPLLARFQRLHRLDTEGAAGGRDAGEEAGPDHHDADAQ